MRALAAACAVLGTLAAWAGPLPPLPAARVDPVPVSGRWPGGHRDTKLAAFDGGTFAIWVDSRPSEAWPDVYGAFFGESGSLASGPQLIAGGPGAQHDPAIACGPASCLAVWEVAGRIFARRYSLLGAPLDAEPLALSGTTQQYISLPTAAFEGQDFRVL